jgi:16S rRNA processing protein RimM
MIGARDDLILLGVIAGAHGVRGQVRIRSFTAEPQAIAAYGPLQDEAGRRRFELRVTGLTKEGVIARIEGVADREAADALRGVRLYLPRSALPPPGAEEFYHADLIGLAAEGVDGAPLGRVVAVQNFGAGDVLEIAPPGDGAAIFVPFSRAAVPVVDVAGRRIVLDPPEGLLEGPPERPSFETAARHAGERPKRAARGMPRRSGVR